MSLPLPIEGLWCVVVLCPWTCVLVMQSAMMLKLSLHRIFYININIVFLFVYMNMIIMIIIVILIVL